LAPTLTRRHRDEWNNARSLLKAADGRAAVATTAAWGLFVLGYGLAMAVVLRQASSGHASAGDVVLALALAAQLSGHVQGIIRNGHFLLLDLRVCAALWRITDHDRVGDDRQSHQLAPPARLATGIELASVSYRYPGTAADAVRKVSVRLSAGSLVAVVGENGAGKSTIVNLLAGLLVPTSGEITIDGHRVDHIDPRHYTTRVGASFQDHVHFELTAGHAVGVGHLPLIDDEEAISATLARVTGGQPSWLAEGLDTKLGASWDGQDLSGGQWQALALARGAMRPGPLLLLLDEPTASLDPRAEARVYERYATLAREAADQAGTVTVFVTHRFASVPDADLILVLEQGRLVESGTHAELMRLDGHYATLYRLQARGFATR
jgi:ATP-binding cassette subfamily B protein